MYIPADYRKTPLGSACSGAFAGGFSVIIFQGLDVIKSRMQGLDAAKYTSSIHCLKELIANEGIMALYKGVGPRMTRVCCEVCTHSAPTPRPLRARSAPALRPPCAHSAPTLHPPTPPTQLPSHFLLPPHRRSRPTRRSLRTPRARRTVHNLHTHRKSPQPLQVAITMTLYGEVVKLLDSVWDTTKPPPRQLAHAGSTLIPVRYDTEVAKK